MMIGRGIQKGKKAQCILDKICCGDICNGYMVGYFFTRYVWMVYLNFGSIYMDKIYCDIGRIILLVYMDKIYLDIGSIYG